MDEKLVERDRLIEKLQAEEGAIWSTRTMNQTVATKRTAYKIALAKALEHITMALSRRPEVERAILCF